MHLLGGTDNCIYWAGLYAQGAAYAVGFFYSGYGAFTLKSVADIEWNDSFAQYAGKTYYTFLSTWRALIVVGGAIGHGFGIWPASGVTAFGALSLWQGVFQQVCERI